MDNMKSVVSISGGKSSAYIYANYPTDYAVFALVRIEDKRCKPKDPIIKREAERRTGKEFVATAEMDETVLAVLDLEQMYGRPIKWVTGKPFGRVIKEDGGILPSALRRFCTAEMKIKPIFDWWRNTINEPVKMAVGFRANESLRIDNMISKTNPKGFLMQKAIVGKSKNGKQNKWAEIEWQKPYFPLYENRIFKDEIENFWNDKPIRFAERNNCVGCFHRNPIVLRMMHEIEPEKMRWFVEREDEKLKEGKKTWNQGGTFRSDGRYSDFIKSALQLELSFDDFGCDAGYCGL